MILVTIHEAKTQLSKLIWQALAGEEIIIAKDRQPLVSPATGRATDLSLGNSAMTAVI